MDGLLNYLEPVVIPASLSKNFLVPIQLEGDLPDYFHLFRSPNDQDAAREVLQPDTMQEFMKCCRAYGFEMRQRQLILSQAEQASDSKDNTVLASYVKRALQQSGNNSEPLIDVFFNGLG